MREIGREKNQWGSEFFIFKIIYSYDYTVELLGIKFLKGRNLATPWKY